MPAPSRSCPLDQNQIIDRYFMENRAKLLDVAAFLDRLERAKPRAEALRDPRLLAMKDAITLLGADGSGRVERLLLLFSDESETPVDVASEKGAIGAAPNRRYGAES